MGKVTTRLIIAPKSWITFNLRCMSMAWCFGKGGNTIASCAWATRRATENTVAKRFTPRARMSSLFKRFYSFCSWYLLVFSLKKVTAAYVESLERLRSTARSYVLDTDNENLMTRNLCACERARKRSHTIYVYRGLHRNIYYSVWFLNFSRNT